MKTSLAFFAVMFLMCLYLFSCNRKDDDCTAGTGGDLTLVVYPQHHGKTISNLPGYPDTVFIKFNMLDKPGDNVYDKYVIGVTGEDHIHLEGLRCGSYYLFAAGYDSTIKQRVVGGIPFTTDKTSGELNITVPVTEGD